MPITIDLTDHALFKRGAKEAKRASIIEMLNDGALPIDKIAKYAKVSVDDVIAIKNELDQKE